MRCAHIVDGTVVNIILADLETFSYDDGSLLVESETAQTGDTYDGSAFATPPAPPPALPIHGLVFLDFMSLFTPAEQGAIVSSADPQIKLFLLMAAGATQIDLDNPKVVGGIGYLVSKSLVTQPRAATILSGALPT